MKKSKGGQLKRRTIEEGAENMLKEEFMNDVNNKEGDILEIDMLEDAQNGEKYYLLKMKDGMKELVLLDAETVNYAKSDNTLDELISEHVGGKYGKKGGMNVGQLATVVAKTPLAAQMKNAASNEFNRQAEIMKKKAEEEAKKRVETIMNQQIPFDEGKIKAILNKLDEKKIKDLMEGIKHLIEDMDDETKEQVKSGDKEVIMKLIMENIMKNPELRKLLIGKLRQELTKNPEMRKFAMEVIKGSISGGDHFDKSENEVEALKRLYNDENPEKLNEIMMDPKESLESKRAAQQLLMKKYL